jgi:hypothetical protein
MSASRLEIGPPAPVLRKVAPDSPSQFVDLQPGDFVEDGHVHASPMPTRSDLAAIRDEVVTHFGSPRPRPPIDTTAFEELVAEVRARVAQKGTVASLDAVLALTDFEPKVIHIRVTPGGSSVEVVDRDGLQELQPQVVFETRSDLVRSTIRSPYGKDLISIGYGAQVYLRSMADLASSPHDRVLNLLAPTQPRWRQRLRTDPRRTLRFLIGDHSMRYAAARRFLSSDDEAAETHKTPAPYDIADWVAVPES